MDGMPILQEKKIGPSQRKQTTLLQKYRTAQSFDFQASLFGGNNLYW
jgi:hypothetical protein